ncbi:MAG: hypothetical protein JRE61_10215 [Deltaproteobacteria bacterium]|nr:hypothetical protein [Deltaproteobacteria bacterium]
MRKFKELLISIEELLISHSIQIDAVTQILVEKGIITNEEFFAKLKQIQTDYQKKSHAYGLSEKKPCLKRLLIRHMKRFLETVGAIGQVCHA